MCILYYSLLLKKALLVVQLKFCKIFLLVGLRCICRPGYKVTKDFGGGNIQCTACGTNEVSTKTMIWGIHIRMFLYTI